MFALWCLELLLPLRLHVAAMQIALTRFWDGSGLHPGTLDFPSGSLRGALQIIKHLNNIYIYISLYIGYGNPKGFFHSREISISFWKTAFARKLEKFLC